MAEEATAVAESPSLPGMEPGTTPESQAGAPGTPGSEAKKLILGKYETDEAAAKGHQSLIDTNVDLKEQLEDLKDVVNDLQQARQVQPDPAAPAAPEAPPLPAGSFQENWNKGSYDDAIKGMIKGEVGGLVSGEVQKALKDVRDNQTSLQEKMVAEATNRTIAMFEADHENHPGFKELKPAIFQSVREKRRVNKNFGTGMETAELVHLLYLEEREKNPDAVDKAAKARAAAISGGGGASGTEEISSETQPIALGPRKLKPKAWRDLNMAWNPDQYKFSDEDKRNMRKTVELMEWERAIRQQRERIQKQRVSS